MKKFLFGLLLMLGLLIMLPLAALAVETQLPTDLLSWGDLGILGVAAGLTVYIVQLLKLPVDKVFGHVPTRIVVYTVALSILITAQIFVPGLGGLTWDSGILCAFNAVLVALAAMATYTKLIKEAEGKKAEAGAVEAVEQPPDAKTSV